MTFLFLDYATRELREMDAPTPVHGNKQLGTGIRLNIAKAFRLMGLAVLAVMIIQGVI